MFVTAGSHSVGPNEKIKVPFPCKCGNGTGLSNHVPVYTIKPGDTLYDIATTTFAGLLKYPQIQVITYYSSYVLGYGKGNFGFIWQVQ